MGEREKNTFQFKIFIAGKLIHIYGKTYSAKYKSLYLEIISMHCKW